MTTNDELTQAKMAEDAEPPEPPHVAVEVWVNRRLVIRQDSEEIRMLRAVEDYEWEILQAREWLNDFIDGREPGGGLLRDKLMATPTPGPGPMPPVMEHEKRSQRQAEINVLATRVRVAIERNELQEFKPHRCVCNSRLLSAPNPPCPYCALRAALITTQQFLAKEGA
jgi:hypothetical protein